jgi:histidinol-phosphate/aromatic aminotransferase/cobyric acid decarboxylase-like protein
VALGGSLPLRPPPTAIKHVLRRVPALTTYHRYPDGALWTTPRTELTHHIGSHLRANLVLAPGRVHRLASLAEAGSEARLLRSRDRR